MSNQEQTLPNYFVIIPSHILDDPNIDDSTAILFGRIASLSNNKGYCFASDKYLGNLTGVKECEIKRRLKTLESYGYIKRETKKNGLFWDRRIYPNFSYEGSKWTPRTVHMDPTERSIRTEEEYKDKQNKDFDQIERKDDPIPFFDKQGKKQTISEEKIRSYLEFEGYVKIEAQNEAIAALKAKKRKVENIYAYSKTIASKWKEKKPKNSKSQEELAEIRKKSNEMRRKIREQEEKENAQS